MGFGIENGGSNWQMQLQIEQSIRQQNIQQVDDQQQQLAAQQLEIQQRVQIEQSSGGPQDAEWTQIQMEFQQRQTQIQFDPNQEYDWQLDDANRLQGQQVDFYTSASMNAELYNNVINSVEDLMKSTLDQEQLLKAAEIGGPQRPPDFGAEWQQEVVQEAIAANADNIAELANREAHQANHTPRPHQVRPVDEAPREQNARALRIDDPRQRFAHMMPPATRPPLEPRPVDNTRRPAETNRTVNNSLSFDLRTRIMMGNQNLAAASAGANVNRPQQSQTASQPNAVPNTTRSSSTQNTASTTQKNNTTAAQDDSVKMSLKFAQTASAKFASFVARIAQNGMPVDINALVQFAIREAYLDGIQDLVATRDKVMYNIEAKKVVREALKQARDAMASARTGATQALQAHYQEWEDTVVAAAKAAMGEAKWNKSVVNDNEIEWYYMIAQAEVNLQNGTTNKDDMLYLRFTSATSKGNGQKIKYSTKFSEDGQKMTVSLSVNDNPGVTGIKDKDRSYILSFDLNNISKEAFISEAKSQLPTYEDIWRAEHPASPQSSEAEDWLDNKTNELLSGYTTMMLDQSQDPPVMVPDSSMKISSKEDMEKYIENLEADLASLGDDNQLANTDLQNVMQKHEQLLSMLSNVSKLLNDTAKAIINKLA